ncbi:MAG: hypothetical protein MUP66_02200 [Candidatus Nanohaloarchaeota archaeon QJJ-5]|nr:hypothetical protein [Candidatus Nanohaloarchaeota archaeon QJJ-5]
MSGNKEATSLFRRGAVLFIAGLAVLMMAGGVALYTGYTGSTISSYAGLLISGVGGYVLKDALIPGVQVATDLAKAGSTMAISVVKQLLRFVILRG